MSNVKVSDERESVFRHQEDLIDDSMNRHKGVNGLCLVWTYYANEKNISYSELL